MSSSKSDRILESAISLLKTAGALISEYTERPLEIKSSMLGSIGKTLDRARQLIAKSQAVGEFDDDDEDVLDVFKVLQDLVALWKRLNRIVEDISNLIHSRPEEAQSMMVDVLTKYAELKLKYQDLEDHITDTILKEAANAERDGMSVEELEIEAQFEENREWSDGLAEMYSANNSATPVYRKSDQLDPLEDYYGYNGDY